jgi:hypothetical protein
VSSVGTVILCGSPGGRTAKPMVRRDEEWIQKFWAGVSLETSASNMVKNRLQD